MVVQYGRKALLLILNSVNQQIVLMTHYFPTDGEQLHHVVHSKITLVKNEITNVVVLCSCCTIVLHTCFMVVCAHMPLEVLILYHQKLY